MITPDFVLKLLHAARVRSGTSAEKLSSITIRGRCLDHEDDDLEAEADADQATTSSEADREDGSTTPLSE